MNKPLPGATNDRAARSAVSFAVHTPQDFLVGGGFGHCDFLFPGRDCESLGLIMNHNGQVVNPL